jgi:hypothetical protein
MPSVFLKYNPEVDYRDLMALTRALPSLIEQTLRKHGFSEAQVRRQGNEVWAFPRNDFDVIWDDLSMLIFIYDDPNVAPTQLDEAKKEIMNGILEHLSDRTKVKVAIDIRPTKGVLAEYPP